MITVLEGNAFYEIDEDCLESRRKREEEAEAQKREENRPKNFERVRL
ncbi:MAG TPA: hypothetical protein IAB44_12405 [Candidatus Limivivens intestinipullorum]|uniref:Uncharacterized protein n=1 Tax=Candidatus Limivivens intestinipullorum TaxID=2840858 RepID=A0A9D1JKR4_9FIRM|nr:hypothetical protein [Candidatus Limivivens intestinipullorum]